MKWRYHKAPKEGDYRTRIKFAWFPIACVDGYERWLTKVKVKEEYKQFHIQGPHYGQIDTEYKWTVVEGYPLDDSNT
jgi:hypothetical protein